MNDNKCCGTCAWYAEFEGVCCCADSEWTADFRCLDDTCKYWKHKDGKMSREEAYSTMLDYVSSVLGSIENSESIVSTCKKELEKDDLPEEQKELLIHTIEDHTYQINSSK